MVDYQFTIPDTREKMYRFFSYGLLSILVVIWVYISFLEESISKTLLYILLPVLLLLPVVIYQKIKKAPLYLAGPLFFILGILLVSKEYYGFGIAAFVFGCLSLFASKKKIIHINQAGISYPTVPATNISWQEINNLILKDDILTIDLKNNKIYQHYIKDADKIVNAAIFNDFCSKKIRS